MNGIEAVQRIRERHAAVRIVVLTTYADDMSAFAELKGSARGYLTKNANPGEPDPA